MKNEEIHKLVIRDKQTYFLVCTIVEHISNLLNQMVTTEIDKKGIYKELKDIFTEIGIQMNEIFYRDERKT